MQWAFEAHSIGYDFNPTTKRHSTQLTTLQEITNLSNIRPNVETVKLAKDDLEVPVVCFDFPYMLLSLFNDKQLNRLENLVINPSNPFGKYEAPDGRLHEINSGAFYDKAYSTMCKNPSKDFLAPIIMYMDKTTVSNNANLHSFPIMFSCSLFKLQVSWIFF
jgi:hypothetical protein